MKNTPPRSFYRKPAVRNIFSIANSTIHLHQSRGLITKSVSLGARAVGWPTDEIDAIVTARIAGKSEADIKELVSRLTAARQSAS